MSFRSGVRCLPASGGASVSGGLPFMSSLSDTVISLLGIHPKGESKLQTAAGTLIADYFYLEKKF